MRRAVTVPSAGTIDFSRTIDTFTNSTGSSIATPVRIVGNLGSDAATTVFATSDGDLLVEPTDLWFGTDDGDGTGTPAIIHLLHGPFGLQPSSVNVIEDNVEWTYDLTVPAGETKRLAYFTVLGTTRAEAIAAANALVTPSGFGGEAAAFLTTEGLASLANFEFNSAPTDLSLSPSSINENLPAQSTVGTFTTDDSNAGDTFTYTLVPGDGDTDNALFVIDENQLKAVASFDFEIKPSYVVRVRTTDAGGLFFEKELLIQVVDLPEDLMLDSEGGPGVVVSAGWGASGSVPGFQGTNYLFAQAGSGAVARFTPMLESDGRYEVFLSSTAHNNRASNAPVRIVHKDGTTATTVNQRSLTGFQSLGTFNFLAGTTGQVSITARDANGIVVADAARFVRVGDLIEAPTVDLASPTSGSNITNVAINTAGKLEVTFQSVAGINPASIIDAAPEIALSGPGAAGVTLSGIGDLVTGNTYEYSFTGEFVPGLVNVDFIAESIADVTGSLNAAENESFTVTDTVVRIELDNTDATQQFTWATSGSVPGYIGTDYLYTNAGGAGRLTYTPTLPQDGAYEVFVTYTGGTSRASNAAYEVNSLAGTSVVRIDQRTGGGTFQSLGVFDFAAGTSGSVTLRAHDADGVVVGDAMRFVRVGELAGAPTATLTDPEAGSTISLVTLNGRDYLDVTFESNSPFGLNTESITDTEAEFTLTGPGAVGVSVNGAATWVSGTTYRYATSGDFSPGAVDAVFSAGSFADLSPVPLTNQASIESFTVIESVTAEVIVDNSDAGFVVSDPEQFVTSSSVRGFIGDNYAAAAPGSTATATWTPTLPQSGTYEVFVRYTSHRLRATNATYVITHNGGTTQVQINQTENGGEWVSLGTYELSAGTAASVQLLTAGANNYVVADAVRFVLP
jgi:hypothetical protein